MRITEGRLRWLVRRAIREADESAAAGGAPAMDREEKKLWSTVKRGLTTSMTVDDATQFLDLADSLASPAIDSALGALLRPVVLDATLNSRAYKGWLKRLYEIHNRPTMSLVDLKWLALDLSIRRRGGIPMPEIINLDAKGETSLDVLRSLGGLQQLTVRGCQGVSSWDFLEALPELHSLRVFQFGEKTLRRLSAARGLRELGVYNSAALVSLAGIEEMVGLKWLILYDLPQASDVRAACDLARKNPHIYSSIYNVKGLPDKESGTPLGDSCEDVAL